MKFQYKTAIKKSISHKDIVKVATEMGCNIKTAINKTNNTVAIFSDYKTKENVLKLIVDVSPIQYTISYLSEIQFDNVEIAKRFATLLRYYII